MLTSSVRGLARNRDEARLRGVDSVKGGWWIR